MSYNLNLPLLQEDELYFTYIRRVMILNALDEKTFCKLLNINNLSPSTLLYHTSEIAKMLNINKPPIEIFCKHSPFNVYRFILSIDDLNGIKEEISNGKFRVSTYYNNDYENAFCPICAKEDIDKYGQFIKRVYLNYHNVNACPIHGCKLLIDYPNETKLDNIKPALDEDINYSRWIKFLYSVELDNACLENSRALCKVKAQELKPIITEFIGIDGTVYKASKRIDPDRLYPTEVLYILYRLYRNNFNLFINDYKAVDYKKIYKNGMRYKCYG